MFLPGLAQGFSVIRLYADEVVNEICPAKPLPEFGHRRCLVREIQGNFTILRESIIHLCLDLTDILQQVYRLGWISNEIVIDNKECSVPAKLEHLPERIRRMFPGSDAHLSAKTGGDVTEFTMKRASPGDLHRHGLIVFQLNG